MKSILLLHCQNNANEKKHLISPKFTKNIINKCHSNKTRITSNHKIPKLILSYQNYNNYLTFFLVPHLLLQTGCY